MAFLDYDGLTHFKEKQDGLVAPIETTTSASRAYSVGDYMTLEGQYYRVTRDIPINGAITVGVNCTLVTIGGELNNKANIDGYYDEMTAGSAEQLISTEAVEDNAPYVFRRSADGMDIGNRETDMLVGGTIAWNQAMTNTFYGTNGTLTSSDGIFHYVATDISTGSDALYHNRIYQMREFPLGHKLLFTFKHRESKSGLTISFTQVASPTVGVYGIASSTEWAVHSKVVNDDTTGGWTGIRISGSSLAVNDWFEVTNAMVFDLTQMFGSTVANYIYGLETAHEGDGVAWFKKLFTKPYYAYNAGTLMSVNVASHVTTGKNQFDKSVYSIRNMRCNTTTGGGYSASGYTISDYIRVVPGQTYTLTSTYTSYFNYYETNVQTSFIRGGSWANKGQKTIPLNAHYIRFDYPTDAEGQVQLELGAFATEYESYQAPHTYAIDSEVTLLGIPKLNSANNLYYDGDTYESDGTITRKYGIVDLGTLTWTRGNQNNDGDGYIFYLNKSNIQGAKTGGSSNTICSKFVLVSKTVWESMKLGEFVSPTSFIAFCSTQTTAENFKTAMSGVYLVYELETETSDEANQYSNPQVVSSGGTEEYVDAGVEGSTRDVSIPVGHVTQYQANLRDKLQHLPNLADGDGTYIINQQNSQMSLQAFSPDFKADINGTYEDMTVGNAEQLVASVGVEDKVPYNFRTSGGSLDIGDRETDEIVGGTIAWNQFFNYSTWTGGTVNDVVGSKANNKLSFVGTASADASFNIVPVLTDRDSHKILIMGLNGGSLSTYYWNINVTGTSKAADTILNWGTGSGHAYGNIRLTIKQGTEVNLSFTPIVVDLTQMFGSGIADYVYGLEQSQAGAGVAWFKNLFPSDYYDYNAGTLLSVNTSAHIMTGFNQVHDITYSSPTTQYYGAVGGSIRFIKGCKYCLSVDTENTGIVLYFAYYPKTVEGISSEQITCNGTRRYFTFTMKEDLDVVNQDLLKRLSATSTTASGQLSNLCINLSWDGERDGEYEPYVEYNYELDSSLELRGIPKLDSGNKLYYDGDTYESDGTVTRRLSEATIAIEGIYVRNSNQNCDFAYFTLPEMWITPLYGKVLGEKVSALSAGSFDNITTTGYVIPYDSSHLQMAVSVPKGYTKAQAEALFNGSKLIYLKATPETEEAESYQNPQIVNDFGTEEYVDYGYEQSTRDVKIPVGHSTFYAANLKAKLEMLPNSPDGDGDYIMRQTDGENEFVQLIIPNELPDSPTTNGTYYLKATVADGTTTLTWESAT